MPSLLAAALALAGLAVPPDEAVQVAARLIAEDLSPGSAGTVVVELDLADGVSASAAGLPAALLQLDVPAGLVLDGPFLDSLGERARNDHLHHPYERALEGGRAEVGFRVAEEGLAEDARLGLVVTGYVTTSDDAFFLRRRLELPLRPDARARPGDDGDSAWGPDEQLLRLGQRAPAVSLPGPDGTTVDLAAHLGQRNLLLVTYRAFW